MQINTIYIYLPHWAYALIEAYTLSHILAVYIYIYIIIVPLYVPKVSFQDQRTKVLCTQGGETALVQTCLEQSGYTTG